MMSLLMWLAVATSWASEEFYWEGPALGSRAEATSMARECAEEGFRCRVVRRFHHGLGWEFVMLVEGFASAEDASEAASVVADRVGRGMSIYGIQGSEAQAVEPLPDDSLDRVEEPAPAMRPPTSEPTVDATPEGPVDAQDLLKAAVRAHGGVLGGMDMVVAAEALLFRFRRHVPDGPVAAHSYARRGEDLYLEVTVERGDGLSSRSGVRGEEAWLETSHMTREDPLRTRETIERFAPEQILSFPLEFARAAEKRRELQLTFLDGTEDIDGDLCDVLRYGGDRVSSPMALAIEQKTGWVRRVVFEGDAGNLRHEYDDYRELEAGLVVPYRLRTYLAGVLVDDVEVSELDLAPRLPEAWFQLPD